MEMDFTAELGCPQCYSGKNQIRKLGPKLAGRSRLCFGGRAVVMVWFQIGYPLVIFMSALQRIDPQIYESARVDGAKGLRMFLSITLPLISPEFYVVILTTIIYSLKIFGPIFALTRGGPGNATMVASYFSYKNFFRVLQCGLWGHHVHHH